MYTYMDLVAECGGGNVVSGKYPLHSLTLTRMLDVWSGEYAMRRLIDSGVELWDSRQLLEVVGRSFNVDSKCSTDQES